MTFRHTLLLLGCLMGLAAQSHAADQPSPASADFNVNALDPRETAHLSIAELETRSARGDVQATAELGARYGRGDGVPKDYKRAFDLLHTAAAKNDPDAEYFLGTAYANGVGVAKNEAEAADWFEKAADQGQPAAEYMMASYITEGHAGIATNWVGAIRYLWDASVKNYPPAQFLLAYAYQEGKGVDANPRAAAYWYRRSNNLLPNKRALYNLNLLIEAGKVPWEEGDPGTPKAASADFPTP